MKSDHGKKIPSQTSGAESPFDTGTSAARAPAADATYSSIYMHFPFCETKCHYCDFYSIGREKTAPQDASTFEKAIIREIQLRAQTQTQEQAQSPLAGPAFAPTLDTIFLGGGTPSMTPPDSMERIFAELFKHTSLKAGTGSDVKSGSGVGGKSSTAPGDDRAQASTSTNHTPTEWTMEANPSSIELQQFKKYRALGINRVSMGVQSLKNQHLAALGRVHDEQHALEALDTVFEAGFTNVSTDLLCGVPGQTLQDLEAHMEKLTSFPITHLSIYLLTLAPHHKMYKDLPDEEEQLKHLLLIDAFMRAKNFRHYEISNFAKIIETKIADVASSPSTANSPTSGANSPFDTTSATNSTAEKSNHQPPTYTTDLRARHNLVYWQGGSYLGFGPSAHSYWNGGKTRTHQRFKNFSSLHKYANTLTNENKLPVEWSESLTADQRELEKWMLAIRLDEGFSTDWLTSERQQKKAEMLATQGLLEPHPAKPAHLRATPRGFALSDAIVKTIC